MTAPVTGRPHPRVPRLERLNALRGPAALLVVLFHVRQIALRDFGSAGPFELWSFGHAGVDLFFVISGFVIYYVHRADIGSPEAAPRFLLRRIVRVYPPLWIVTTLVLVGALLVPGAVHAQKLDAWFTLRSYLLIPIRDALPLLPPAWTLSHELKFYIGFAAAIALPALVWRPLVGAILAASVAVAGLELAGRGVAFPLDFILSPYNLEFALGVCAAIVARRIRVPAPRALALIGAALWIVAAAHDAVIGSPDAAEVVRFGPASGLVVLGVAARDFRQHAFHVPVARLLGDASYAIYLVHLPVIIVGTRVLRHAHAAPTLPMLSLLAIVATLVGIAFHVAVERPITAALNAQIRRQVPARVPAR